MSYHVNEKGYYGDFGGAYIPEMLYPNVEELRQNYSTNSYAIMSVGQHLFTMRLAYRRNTTPRST